MKTPVHEEHKYITCKDDIHLLVQFLILCTVSVQNAKRFKSVSALQFSE